MTHERLNTAYLEAVSPVWKFWLWRRRRRAVADLYAAGREAGR